MTTGDIVIHKKTGERMRIKILTENIATCELIDRAKEQKTRQPFEDYQISICKTENLIYACKG